MSVDFDDEVVTDREDTAVEHIDVGRELLEDDD